MLENGFYKIKPEFIQLINRLGGRYTDHKERPIFCCIEDAHIKNLYWAIPTSDLSHRSPDQIDKIIKWNNEKGIRSAYYHIGYTNRPALYKISNCFPITDKYIDAQYISQGQHLILRNKSEIEVIQKKLSRILFDESIHPNKYEQHITTLQNYLAEELAQKEKSNLSLHLSSEKTNPVEKERTPFNDLLVELHKEQQPSKKAKKRVPEQER